VQQLSRSFDTEGLCSADVSIAISGVSPCHDTGIGAGSELNSIHAGICDWGDRCPTWGRKRLETSPLESRFALVALGKDLREMGRNTGTELNDMNEASEQAAKK
jgi:hypothetical protein